MSKKPFYRHVSKYKNDIDLIDKLVSIYSVIKKGKKDQILPFEKSVLIYYILFGFTKETKETIRKELKKSDNSINTTNSNLRKKGFLVRTDTNFTKSYVNKELQSLADEFRKNSNMHYTISFIK